MDYSKLIDEAANWVEQYIETQQQDYCFHDLKHTLDVVNAAQKIAQHYGISEPERFIVVVSAYFHDLGYYTGGAAGHELRGADIATEFLRQRNVESGIIDSIRGCIIATRIPQKPKNLLESIVCDADLFHFGSQNFSKRDKLMRREKKATGCKPQDSKGDWYRSTLSLMENHTYHTDYAKQLLDDIKAQNILILKAKEKELFSANDGEKASVANVSGKKNRERLNRPDRGIETMFRITSTNNQRLSDMADNKANILLTVNSIILSVIIAVLVRKLEESEYLAIPTFILLLVSLSTMVVAILATRPKIPPGEFVDEDVKNKSVNLLFFGNFYKMGLDKYYEGMKKVMEDREFLYGTLTRDVYSQGVVLGRKYKLLRLGYNIFMFGLIIAVIAFLTAIIIYDI